MDLKIISEVSWILLGQAASPLVPGAFHLSPELKVLFGAVLALVLLVVLWALVFHKRKDDLSRWRVHRHRHHHEQHDSSTSDAPPEQGHRRRRRRREHRPRNPTLAETGGLPPVRSDPPPESSS